MAKAKMISDQALEKLLDDVARDSRDARRDFVIVLLSCKAGLRAQEIAGIQWRDVTDAAGAIVDDITVPAAIAKKGHEREVPMHPQVREALELLRESLEERHARGLGPKPTGKTPIVLSARGWDAMTPNTLAQFMLRLYRRHGLDASSHSGRRTVITKMARVANEFGCSLFDAMRIAGHKDIETTEAYVVHSDGAREMMRNL